MSTVALTLCERDVRNKPSLVPFSTKYLEGGGGEKKKTKKL